jgi:PAS domain S-box-containing protein
VRKYSSDISAADLDGEAEADAAMEYREVFLSRSSGEYNEVLPSPSLAFVRDDLVTSERHYRRLFEMARDGVLLLDMDTGRITDANPCVYELLGCLPGTLLGKELWEVGLFGDREASQALFLRCHKSGCVRYDGIPLQSASGEQYEVEFVGFLYQENGRNVIQCNFRDITERRQSERALHVALERERRISGALQQILTEKVVENAFPGFQVAACYEPALKEAQVGGDFYDAFALSSGNGQNDCRIVLAVGDVTGKGLHAAVLARRVKDVLRAFAHEDPAPERVLMRLNNYLCDPVSNSGCYNNLAGEVTILSLALAVLNPGTGEVTLSSAGAEPPVILRSTGDVEVMKAGGLLLGVQQEAHYTIDHLRLLPGDTLLITTDGITEARRRDNDRREEPGLLGYEGMLTMAQKHRGLPSLREMSQAILEEARNFSGGFHDDVCLLVARRRGENREDGQ